MDNVIHIDEKWFYLNQETRKFYLLPNEENPYRCEQSKRFKVKAMFMAMIGKPQHNRNEEMIHDGKYGIFGFVYEQRAKKSSKNKAAGTMELKALQSVTKDVIKDMLVNKLIPTIIQNWPAHLSKDIVIQWDNASSHKIPTDLEFVATCTQNGFNIKMVYQPPQSPDLNVLDLGKGGNNFTLPHMKKRRLEQLGILPERLTVSPDLVAQAVNHLNDRFRPVNQTQVEEDHETEVDVD
ncbi:uncharacterized protein LOC110737441 [Chenopodium quinoa]|uniref:uncharacterized protein LOC110737441 n=1 Tax=Chenopodium quinoa TaxID=63459 RepID=UPI000B772410|nr:uncharacterized protein LOC110737441 [Chenopodium quinoa]